MSTATRLAAVERALELLGHDANAERELVGPGLDDQEALEQLEGRLFSLLVSHGLSTAQLEAARERWPADPEGTLEALFGEIE